MFTTLSTQLSTRLAAFAGASVLTLVMLLAIDGLAVTEHHDVRLAHSAAQQPA